MTTAGLRPFSVSETFNTWNEFCEANLVNDNFLKLNYEEENYARATCLSCDWSYRRVANLSCSCEEASTVEGERMRR